MNRDPFSVLEAEHEDALAALQRLESAAHALQVDPTSEPDRRVVHAVLRILTAAVRDHNKKEEDLLFPLLGDEAPTAIFEEEHRRLWALERELADLLDVADPRTSAVALDIVELLRAHIARENEVLFPMARELLGPREMESLAERLSR